MENVVIRPDFWSGRRVLVTGHTGFKGSWSVLLLSSLGAEVHGFALPPAHENGIFEAAGVEGHVRHRIGDVRDLQALTAAFAKVDPHIIIHMAAQSLVKASYADPVETYATNVMGTVHLLEAARTAPSLEAVVVVTSDKCYENTGAIWPYRETDPMGGHDPYSNSKGCSELVTSAYRRSFFHQPRTPEIASVRAGNVIGGGDWSPDRLVPDAMRSFFAETPLRIRNPYAVRPWQHVLDPVFGYLKLAELLVGEGSKFAEGWNFGPAPTNAVPVHQVADKLVRLWGEPAAWEQDRGEHIYEAATLKLDSTKAAAKIGWEPAIDLDEALRLTVDWYRAHRDGADMGHFTLNQIEAALALLS